MLHRLGRHRLEHAQRADDVVAVVADRIAHRLADVEKRGEVHDADDFMRPQRRPDAPRRRRCRPSTSSP